MTKSTKIGKFSSYLNRRPGSGGKSLSWQLILPVPIAIVLCVVAIALFVPMMMAGNAREQATRQGEQVADQFKIIRGYYTQNVIKKVVKSGSLKPSVNHKNEAASIPLPATFIHDVSKLLANKDMTVNLYSGFPWSNRKDRKLDEFQSQAWAFLTANPDKVYSKQATVKGKEVVRVAVSDKMVAKGCVSCHNSNAGSPKTDWKLGDVRGVLEVSTVITPQLAAGAAIAKTMVIAAIVVGIILTLLAILGVKSITRPLLNTVCAMKRLAEGDNDVEVQGLERQDEIGQMSSAVQVFKENAIRNKELEAEQVKQNQRAETEQREMMNKLADDFDSSVGRIIETVSSASAELNSTSQSMASISEEASSKATAVAAASEEASVNVQTVAAATEEMSNTIGEINCKVADASLASKKAVKDVATTAGQMKTLAQTADKIGNVVSMISDIAEQTNLLALNATIESARAGEAGKGFAVVASEVKSLANETAKATESISAHIQEIQSATGDAVTSIDGIGNVIRQIEESSTAIAAAMEEQGASTQEVARNVQEVASGTQEVSSNISGVTQASQEAGAASGQVMAAAGELSKQAELMKTEVAKFLEQVRAA